MGNTAATDGGNWATALRRARKRLGWSHDRLAEESGVTRWTLLRWEKGDPVKYPDQVSRVATAVGIAPEDAYRMLGWLPATTDDTGAKVDELAANWARQLRELTPAERERLLDAIGDEEGRRFIAGLLRTWDEMHGGRDRRRTV